LRTSSVAARDEVRHEIVNILKQTKRPEHNTDREREVTILPQRILCPRNSAVDPNGTARAENSYIYIGTLLQLIPWSRGFEKLTVPQLVKSHAFYGARRFITVFTTAYKSEVLCNIS